MKKAFFLSLTISIMFLSVIAVSTQANAQQPDRSQVVIAFGKVPGQDLYAHVWVVVPHGADKNKIVDESLRQQGLKPFDHADFSTTGMVHDQFFDNDPDNDVFIQYYNPANDPTGNGHSILQESQKIWNDVSSSNFAFMPPEVGVNDLITDRCPSLVRECPGRQVTDSFNDVAWMPIKDPSILGVTWYKTSADEADMALNTKFTWNDSGNSGTFDPKTVFLHEEGHVLGLGHSEVKGAVMEPVYAGLRQALHSDDICGISTLYGPEDYVCKTTEPTVNPPTDPVAGEATSAEISYQMRNGPNGGLVFTVLLKDDASQPVSATSVKVELLLDGSSLGSISGDTNEDGKAAFILYKPVPPGQYTTTVLQVAGFNWDSNHTIDPGFTK